MIRVVVVEDEKMIRKGIIMTTDWNAFGCQVVGEASSGREGLEVIKEKNPEIVITDVRMKGMTGLEMIEALEDRDRMSFIIISGYSDFEYARSAIRLGVRDYLLKPFKDEDLKDVLDRVTSEIRSRRKAPEKVILEFFKEYEEESQSSSGRYIRQAIRYLEENYMKEVTSGIVSESLGISESYLCKIFKKETGYTFVDYLTHYRMKKAVMIMEKDSPKIYELAYLVGYNDPHYFSSIFKKITGMSPSSYRRTTMEIDERVEEDNG